MARMTEPAPTEPRSFLTEVPAATLDVGFSLMSRRSSAIADFWRSVAEVRQPTDFMAVQLNYWTRLLDDYQTAFTESVAPMAEAGSRAAPPRWRPVLHSA